MTNKKSNYVVVGRIPDDENHVLRYDNCTEKQAVRRFEKDLYGDLGQRGKRAEVLRAYGQTLLIIATIQSDSPISIKYYNQ